MKNRASKPVPEALSLQVEMRYEPTTVKLSMIDHKTYAKDFCHREESVYEWDDEDEGNKMKLLADSFVLEGQQVPLELIDDPRFPGTPEGTKPLLRGSRRVNILHKIIERRIDPDHFHLDMEVKVVLVSGGEYKDYLVRSVCDNELRVELSDDKKLEAAERMLKKGVSATRAARALGMSATHFGRYTRRINSVAMQAHIASGHITPTNADALLEAAGQFNRIAEMEQDFAAAVAQIQKEIDDAREKAARNKDKFDEKKHGAVKNQIKPAHVSAWIKAIRDGKRFAAEAPSDAKGDRTVFACKLDIERGELKIPPLKMDLYKADFADLGEVAGKLTLTAERVERFYLMRKAHHDLNQDRPSDDGNKAGLLDYFRSHGDAANAAKIEAEIARYKGVADPGHGAVAPRAETPLADAIVVPAEPLGHEDEEDGGSGPGDEPEATAVEFDPAIDGGPAGPGSAAPPTPKARKGKDAR